MNTTAALLTALGLVSVATTATATAATQATDIDYLKASRCRGLAVGLGADAAGLTAYVKAQSGGRAPYITEQADEEFAKARREAHGEAKERLSAELNGACAAYVVPSKAASVR
jgi:hypothetical protein